MELTTFNFWGKTKYWWGIMLVGILLIPAGLWLLFQPVMGYAVISMLLGWGLILFEDKDGAGGLLEEYSIYLSDFC